jgi:dihydroorotase-like cyclic amidohydrolase
MPSPESVQLPKTMNFPGFIDMHVHARGMPEDDYKETIESATQAAIAGGVTTIVDMPNNKDPYRIDTFGNLGLKRALATPEQPPSETSMTMGRGAYSDMGMYYGHQPEKDNIGSFEFVLPMVLGVKFYLEPSTGNNTTYEASAFAPAVEAIRRIAPGKLIVIHSEDETIRDALHVTADFDQPVHVAHVSSQKQLETIIEFQDAGFNVSAEACPHHLFFTEDEFRRLGWEACMKPFLGKQSDRAFLWANKDRWEVIATDHAPHSGAEKDEAQDNNPNANPDGITCYGVPGLEAFLPMMITAVRDGKLSRHELKAKTSTNPARILGIPVNPGNPTFSKAAYGLYAGRSVVGRVVETKLHGQVVYKDGKFTNNHATGELISPGAH